MNHIVYCRAIGLRHAILSPEQTMSKFIKFNFFQGINYLGKCNASTHRLNSSSRSVLSSTLHVALALCPWSCSIS